jgi:hypothetical protein
VNGGWLYRVPGFEFYSSVERRFESDLRHIQQCVQFEFYHGSCLEAVRITLLCCEPFQEFLISPLPFTDYHIIVIGNADAKDGFTPVS